MEDSNCWYPRNWQANHLYPRVSSKPPATWFSGRLSVATASVAQGDGHWTDTLAVGKLFCLRAHSDTYWHPNAKTVIRRCVCVGLRFLQFSLAHFLAFTIRSWKPICGLFSCANTFEPQIARPDLPYCWLKSPRIYVAFKTHLQQPSQSLVSLNFSANYRL